MSDKILLWVHAVLTLTLMALEPCQDKPKKQQEVTFPPPFGEQKPIVRYQVIGEFEFTVQVGERPHESLYNATVLASRLRAAGVACFIEKSRSGGKYRVCVGRFLSQERAENMRKILLSKNIDGGRVVGPFKD